MKELPLCSSAGLHGTLTVPGDKSISHRALMIGAIAHGTTRIHHFLRGNDCLSTLHALANLGVKIHDQGDTIVIDGNGFASLHSAAQPLNLGNSGTTTRLLMGLLAGSNFTTKMVGDASLSRRPMKRVSEPLAAFGGQVQLSPAGTLPATVIGQPLHGATYQLTVASAQVKSALILAALQADCPSTITEKLPTRNHTEIMLRQFGANIHTDGCDIHVVPGTPLRGQELTIPGDMSSAAFFLVAAAIIPHSRLTVTGVNLNPTRTGILAVLQKMGARLSVETTSSIGEPVGNITIVSSHLRPIHLTAHDIPAVIDELPLVALLAARAEGQSTIRGAEELRVKETDRIKTVASELRKLGVAVKELPDGMVITGRPHWQIVNDQLDSYGDHRLGMMAAIAALGANRPLQLAHAAAIAVSYPHFFTDLATLMGGKQQ